jgi:hypothetical protein
MKSGAGLLNGTHAPTAIAPNGINQTDRSSINRSQTESFRDERVNFTRVRKKRIRHYIKKKLQFQAKMALIQRLRLFLH